MGLVSISARSLPSHSHG